MNGTYELTVIYPANLDETKQKKTLSSLEEVVAKLKGTTLKKADWGRRPLAYPIKKETQGYYAHWQVKLPPSGPSKLTKTFNMDDTVLRYLLLKSERKIGETPKKKTVVKKKVTKEKTT